MADFPLSVPSPLSLQQTDLNNLPMVDIPMLTNYVKQDLNCISSGGRNVKAGKSKRESYGDDASG